MNVVYQPPARHYCGPNQYGIWLENSFDAEGTVRECTCGETWVAFRDRRDPGYMGVKWRHETWRERRHRRKSAPAVTEEER